MSRTSPSGDESGRPSGTVPRFSLLSRGSLLGDRGVTPTLDGSINLNELGAVGRLLSSVVGVGPKVTTLVFSPAVWFGGVVGIGSSKRRTRFIALRSSLFRGDSGDKAFCGESLLLDKLLSGGVVGIGDVSNTNHHSGLGCGLGVEGIGEQRGGMFLAHCRMDPIDVPGRLVGATKGTSAVRDISATGTDLSGVSVLSLGLSRGFAEVLCRGSAGRRLVVSDILPQSTAPNTWEPTLPRNVVRRMIVVARAS